MARTQDFLKAQGLDMTGPGLIAENYQDSLTAHAGGGQANGVLIVTQMARFTTVATIGDSATLPTAAQLANLVPQSTSPVGGIGITIANAATNSMNVFPGSGESINALAANTAFAVAGGKTATFWCATAGVWHSVLSA
jgi:hypothetical protein